MTEPAEPTPSRPIQAVPPSRPEAEAVRTPRDLPAVPGPPPPPELARWVAVGAFVAAGLLPTLAVLWVSATSRPSASTGSRVVQAQGTGELAAILSFGILLVGSMFAAIGFAVARARRASTRTVWSTLTLVGAVACGVVTGFLGVVIVAIAKEPTGGYGDH